MNTNDRRTWDEARYIAHFETLEFEADKIEGALKAAGVKLKEHPNRPDSQAVNTDAIKACDDMEAFVAGLRTQASLARVKLPSPGAVEVSGSAVPVLSGPARDSIPKGTTLTATEKLLCVENVESTEQLAEKRARQRYDSYATQRKRIGRASLLISALLLLLGVPVKAQQSGTYTLIPDSTNTIAAATTNQPIYFNVSEYNDFMLMIRARGHSGTASNVQAYLYRSLTTDLYETAPWKVLQLQLSGTATNLIKTNLDVGGVAALKLVLANTNAVVITNVNAKAGFKASKIKLGQ